MVKNTAPDGILLVDKPPGMTSHDVVDAVRRKFRIKKVGHCGTLDPNATGLLILVLGKATKLSERLMGQDKVYQGSIELGRETNSYDVDGETVSESEVPELSLEEMNKFAASEWRKSNKPEWALSIAEKYHAFRRGNPDKLTAATDQQAG